jgi:hypothetical protein
MAQTVKRSRGGGSKGELLRKHWQRKRENFKKDLEIGFDLVCSIEHNRIHALEAASAFEKVFLQTEVRPAGAALVCCGEDAARAATAPRAARVRPADSETPPLTGCMKRRIA